MKIFLDDERIPVADGWTICRTADDFVTMIADHSSVITAMSFDHDLGDNSESGAWCIRHIVDCMLDDETAFGNLRQIIFHSANMTGCINMHAYCEGAAQHVTAMQNVDLVMLPSTTTNSHARMPENFNYDDR